VVVDGAGTAVVSGVAITGAAAVVTAASLPAQAEPSSTAAAPTSLTRAARAVRSIISRLATGYGAKGTEGGRRGGSIEHDVLASFLR
jgi:hypothetical protein